MKIENNLQADFKIDPLVIEYVKNCETEVLNTTAKLDELAEYHQYRVIKAMQKVGLSDRHFHPATGYGYDDIGREAVESIYADLFDAEAALVRPHISSGTHAISLALYGVLRPGDELLAITGSPYDTIRTVIGIEGDRNKNIGTLGDFGVTYRQIELNEAGKIDLEKVLESLADRTKMVYLQRSTGYSWRGALTLDDIAEAVTALRQKKPEVVIFVDNCYGEFLDVCEPTALGVDLVAGSLIKNPGGGLAPTGGYVIGKEKFVYQAACRLAAPGVAVETGATGDVNRTYLQGLFLAPTVVTGAIKTAILMARCYEKLNFEVCPGVDAYRSDIIQSIKLGSAEAVKVFCKAVQEAAPVDSFLTPEPWEMPGYSDEIIMAAGAFIQGSSIELSADAPMREPYIAYFQGGLTHYHGKLGLLLTLQRLLDHKLITMEV